MYGSVTLTTSGRERTLSNTKLKCHDLECGGTGVVKCKHCRNAWRTTDLSQSSTCAHCAGTRKSECQICDGTGNIPIGDVLLDGTTLVQSYALINGNKLTPATVHCLSLLLQSLVLNNRLVFVEPCSEEASNIFHNALRMLPDELVKLVRLPYTWVSWDRLVDVPVLAIRDDKGNALSKNPDLCALEDPREAMARDAAFLYYHVRRQRGWRRKIAVCGDALGSEWLRDAIMLDSPYPTLFIHEPDNRVLQAITSFRSALYFRLMHYLNIPYRPEFYRVKLFRNAIKSINARFGMLALQILSQLDRAIDEQREIFSKFTSYRHDLSVQLQLPVITSVVLQNARCPENIISAALQLRNSHEARAFRKAAQQFELEASTGADAKSSIEYLLNVSQKLKSLSTDTSARLETAMFPSVAYSIRDGFTGGSLNAVTIPINICRAVMNKIRHRNVALLDVLSKKSLSVWNLNSVLRQVFNKELDETAQRELSDALTVSR